jgi:hypothetical protein
VEEYIDEEDIKHEFSMTYTPEQNSVVERKNRTLFDMTRTMLNEYKTLGIFWVETINIACHAIDRLYLHNILKKTSYELLTLINSRYHILVFGCKCFILNKRSKSFKFAPKVNASFLLGYRSNKRANHAFINVSNKVEVAIDVRFHETNSPQ